MDLGAARSNGQMPVVSAEVIRDEIAMHLRRIGESCPTGSSVKARVNHVVAQLGHSELDWRAIKRLWYREIRTVPAHLADHIRSVAAPKDDARLCISKNGHIRSVASAGFDAAVVRIAAKRSEVAIELNEARITAASAASLQNYLLTLFNDDRPIRLIFDDQNRVTDLPSAIDALDALERVFEQGRSEECQGTTNIGLHHDDVKSSEHTDVDTFRITSTNDHETARSLALKGAVVFVPGESALTVYAKASSYRSEGLEQALPFLAQQCGQIQLRVWWFDGWLHDCAIGGQLAVESLIELTNRVVPESRPSKYRAERTGPESLSETEMRRLLPLMGLVGGNLDRWAINSLLAAGFGDRLTISEIRDGKSRWVYIGHGFDFMQPSWCIDGVGGAISDMPDKEYGKNVEAAFVSAASEGAPRIERVRALIKEWTGASRRCTYRRIILPFGPTHRRLCLGYTVSDRPDRFEYV